MEIMKNQPTTETSSPARLVYEPIRAESPEPAVRVSDFIKLIARLAQERAELPVIG
jgi:hypothetical protein